MRVAAIDIGTNSVLLLVLEAGPAGPVALLDRAVITRLGQGVDRSGVLAEEAIARTLACLREYAADMRRAQVERVATVATSAMRDASNGDAFLEAAEAVLGARPEVISGAREAELTFEGALAGLSGLDAGVAVFDIGGGSTEIISGDARTRSVAHAVSLDIGSVRLTERHVGNDPPTADELAAIRADVASALASAPAIRGLPLVGVAGTVTTLAAVARAVAPYDGAKVHGAVLTRADIAELLARFSSCTLSERTRLPGLEPQRADVIIAGTIITGAICEAAGAPEIIVSDRGVRWGLAAKLATPS